MSLIKASRWRAARKTRSSGSSSSSRLKSRASSSSISVTPMMALSGVRSSWAHAGEELRLVLAGFLELPALVLDFLEQPHVLDGDGGLVRERTDQFDLLLGKRPHLGARQCHHTDRHAFTQHRNAERGANAAEFPGLRESKFWIGPNIYDMNTAASEQGASADTSAFRFNRHGSDPIHEFSGEAAGFSPIEYAIYLPGDRALVGIAKPNSGFDQRLQHRFEVEGRAADDFEHVGGGGLLLKRFPQLIQQSGVLNRDDGLGGEVRNQFNVLFGERLRLLPIDDYIADQLALFQHRNG